MPKAAKNSKPNSSSARPAPSPRAIRAQLVAAGLLKNDGHVVGIADHPDADFFARAARWRLAWNHFDQMHGAAVIAQNNGRAVPAGFHKACASLQAAEQAVLAPPPVTPDGVAVLLDAAAESADDLPALHEFIATALRSFKAIGL